MLYFYTHFISTLKSNYNSSVAAKLARRSEMSTYWYSMSGEIRKIQVAFGHKGAEKTSSNKPTPTALKTIFIPNQIEWPPQKLHLLCECYCFLNYWMIPVIRFCPVLVHPLNLDDTRLISWQRSVIIWRKPNDTVTPRPIPTPSFQSS